MATSLIYLSMKWRLLGEHLRKYCRFSFILIERPMKSNVVGPVASDGVIVFPQFGGHLPYLIIINKPLTLQQFRQWQWIPWGFFTQERGKRNGIGVDVSAIGYDNVAWVKTGLNKLAHICFGPRKLLI